MGPSRFRSEGPNNPIGGQTLVVIGLILHELGTNAAKYGALSVPAGRVSLSWRKGKEPESGGEVLVIDWQETGGPAPKPSPATSRGFGSTLMTRIIASVGGHTDIDYPETGAFIRMTLPTEMLNPVIEVS